MNPARPSAAVILVREAGRGIEVFMGQRHGRATFASTFVFPGGVLGPEDASVHARCRGLDAEEADRRLGVDAGGLDYYSAAIRELFEETGVLLAVDAAGEWVGSEGPGPGPLADTRRRLQTGRLSWPGLLAAQGIELAADRLHYVAHWETPVVLSARFSTRFFLAELPPGQQPVHDGEELIASRWLTPHGALALHRRGEIDLPFPHMKHLERLSRLPTPEALWGWARERWRAPVVKVRPWLIEARGERRFVLPSEPGYPDEA